MFFGRLCRRSVWRELEVVEAESESGDEKVGCCLLLLLLLLLSQNCLNGECECEGRKELPVCTLMRLFRQVGWMIQSSPSVFVKRFLTTLSCRHGPYKHDSSGSRRTMTEVIFTVIHGRTPKCERHCYMHGTYMGTLCRECI